MNSSAAAQSFKQRLLQSKKNMETQQVTQVAPEQSMDSPSKLRRKGTQGLTMTTKNKVGGQFFGSSVIEQPSENLLSPTKQAQPTTGIKTMSKI